MSPRPRTTSKPHSHPRSRPDTQHPLSPSLLPTLHPNLDLDYERTTLSSLSPSRSRSHITTHNHAHAYDLDDHATATTTTLIELDDPGLAVQKAIEIVGKAIEYDTKGEYAVSLLSLVLLCLFEPPFECVLLTSNRDFRYLAILACGVTVWCGVVI